MILRGLVISASGFLLIFAPGLAIGLLRRRFKTYNSNLLYWGIGAWALGQLLGILGQTLLYQILIGPEMDPARAEGLEGFLLAMLGELLIALLVVALLYLALRLNRPPEGQLVEDSIYLGFGSALLDQVFVGLTLIGAGLPVIFGDTSSPITGDLAEGPLITLVLFFAALIAVRAALPIVWGAMGYFTGQALNRQLRFVVLAVVTYLLIKGILRVLLMTLDLPGDLTTGDIDALGSLVWFGYYGLVLALGYRWLQSKARAQA